MVEKGYFGGGRDLWGQVEIRNVNAALGIGFHKLIFELQVTFTQPPPHAGDGWVGPIFFAATAWVSKGEGSSAPSHFLGSVQFPEPFLVFPAGWSAGFAPHLQGFASLTQQQIEALEAMRDGDDLSIRFDTNVLVTGKAEPLPFSAQFTHSISRSQWVKLLDHMGYRRTLLLEVPVPMALPGLAKAVNYLESSLAAITSGPSGRREAIGLCRDAIESLREARGDKADEDRVWQKRSDEMESFDKRERTLLVRRALHRLTSAAKHPSEVVWTRRDAQSVVAMVAALLHFENE